MPGQMRLVVETRRGGYLCGRRRGSPYTLVLDKTEALFAREREARIRDETDLEWLAAQWNPAV